VTEPPWYLAIKKPCQIKKGFWFVEMPERKTAQNWLSKVATATRLGNIQNTGKNGSRKYNQGFRAPSFKAGYSESSQNLQPNAIGSACLYKKSSR